MPATLINGSAIAEDVKKGVAEEVAALKRAGVEPGLTVILVGEDAASSSYVNMKARTCEMLGIRSQKIALSGSISTDELLAQVRQLNADDRVDGILIQLPLPKQVQKHVVLESVMPAKDVDGFHSSNLGSLLLGHETLVACTPLGVMELLRRSNVKMEGANA